jgi:chromosome segregation ATPase
MKTKSSILLLLVSTLTLLNAGSVWAGQEKLAAAMRDTREEMVQTRDQLSTTVDSISALVSQKKGDLRPAYEKFEAQVAKTQAAAAATRARAQKMQTEANTHFSAWRMELDSINNPKLKAKGMKRQETVEKSYNRVTKQIQEAAEKFDPYLSDLADMKKMLANDLSPSGVKALRGTVGDAKFHLTFVRRPINDAIVELDKMQKTLTSTVGP